MCFTGFGYNITNMYIIDNESIVYSESAINGTVESFLSIGGYKYAGSSAKGHVYDIMIYNKSLSPSEIQLIRDQSWNWTYVGFFSLSDGNVTNNITINNNTNFLFGYPTLLGSSNETPS